MQFVSLRYLFTVSGLYFLVSAGLQTPGDLFKTGKLSPVRYPTSHLCPPYLHSECKHKPMQHIHILDEGILKKKDIYFKLQYKVIGIFMKGRFRLFTENKLKSPNGCR